MQDKNKFMQAAIDLARENLKFKNGGPFGAVIVKNGKIIGRGVNTVTTNNDPTAHAEVNAIREACENLNTFRLEGCDIYSSCEPCPMCLGAIYWARPRKLFFATSREDAAKAGFDDAEIYKELELPFAKRKLPTEQLMKSEGEEIFKTWIDCEFKTEY
jgi:tRNA(Arg) A34 adenosine deaminase TadA